MPGKQLRSSAVGAFCSSIALMLAAGIQVDEAVYMLSENRAPSHFKRVCDAVYASLIKGASLAQSMKESEAFPAYAVTMVRIGESTGHTEHVLRSLGDYYDTEHRSFTKLQSAIGYPAALLCIMSIILAFTVVFVLPIFITTYNNISGSLTAGSFGMIQVSMVIGWIALVLVGIITILALIASIMARSASGRTRIIALLEKFPFTKQAMYQMALSRFTNALAVFIASGVQPETGLRQSIATTNHPLLKTKLEAALAGMTDLENPRSLSQAIVEHEVLEPIYGRMLLMGTRSGSADKVLCHLSTVFFDDANAKIDTAIDYIEPILAAFLTIAVGATLIAVMLPLIGIMGSIA